MSLSEAMCARSSSSPGCPEVGRFDWVRRPDVRLKMPTRRAWHTASPRAGRFCTGSRGRGCAPILSVMPHRTLACVFAHPDDDAYGAAGSVALHADEPDF